MPKDKVTASHQGYGFCEFRSEEDADYAIKVRAVLWCSIMAAAWGWVGFRSATEFETLPHDRHHSPPPPLIHTLIHIRTHTYTYVHIRN